MTQIAPALVLVLAAAITTSPAGAQVPDTLRRDTVYEIEPIAVRAVRPSATTGGVSAVTVRLDSVRFRAAPLLEHVLRELPLVQVRRNSRGEAQLALRGAEERQIAILLDGVPLTLGWDHRTDLSVIPMTAAQTVRVIRGMSSVLHGPNVLGGVVEIGMGSMPVPNVEPLQASVGVDGTGGYAVGVRTAARLEGMAGDLVVRGGVGRREHDGLRAPDDAPSLYPSLSADRLRVNTDLEHTDGFLTARFTPAAGGWLSATVSGFEAERGVAPELGEQRPRLWRYPRTSRVVGVLSGGSGAMQNGLGTASVDVNLGLDLGATMIHDFALPAEPSDPTVAASRFFSDVDATEESDDLTTTLRMRAVQELTAGVVSAAVTLADIRHDEVITVGVGGPSPRAVPGEYRQRLWSVGAEVDIPFKLPADAVPGGRVTGGLVWDGADTPRPGPDAPHSGPTMTEWGGRLGVSAATGADVLLHSAISRRGRFPALREMYSTALGRFAPNPDLRPEILSAVEAGFTGRFGDYDLQVVGFHQRLDGAITRGAPPEGSTARYMRVNRDRIRSTGLELMAGYSAGRLALETELTLQSVDVIEPGRDAVRAEYEPELSGGVGGTLPLIAGIEAAAEVSYWGRQFCAAPSPGEEAYETLEPGTRADLELARTFRLAREVATLRRVGVEIALDNLTDATLYDQCGLPQPGRTLRLQVRLD